MASLSRDDIDHGFSAAIASARRQGLSRRSDIESAVLNFLIGYLGAATASEQISQLVNEKEADHVGH